MEAAAGFLKQAAEPSSASEITERYRFTITELDVGSEAVRVGIVEQLEGERNVLLAAARMVLARVRAKDIRIGADAEFALEAAIRVAEIGDL